jgi:hypothetical protein
MIATIHDALKYADKKGKTFKQAKGEEWETDVAQALDLFRKVRKAVEAEVKPKAKKSLNK